MLDKNLNIVYSSSITNVVSLNSSFDSGVMRVAYHGDNKNKTSISKQAFEDSMASIYNCPVVCNYSVSDDSIGGHDMELVHQGDGNYKLINITHPVGIVPESASTHWEYVTEEDGSEHEYLCTDILLWKRQSAYDHIKDMGDVDESMEIKVLEGERKEDGYYHVYKFEFTAFCLLERDKPCFESAGIKVFSLDGLRDECAEMLEDLKREFSSVSTAEAEDIKLKNSLEGGDKPLNIEELMGKYGLTDQDVDFDVSAMELSEVEERFAQIRENKIKNEHVKEQTFEEQPEEHPADEPTEEINEEHEESYSLTAQQMLEEIYSALCAETIMSEFYGAVPRYYYVDHDPAVNMVYAIDSVDYKLYGLAYSMSGDNVVIAFEDRKRMKIAFVDFEDGDAAAEPNFEMMYSAMTSAMEQKFAVLSGEINELQKFKADVQAQERKAQIDAVISRFSDLEENEAFIALRSECYDNNDMTVEAIEEKCFAIRGRSTDATVKFSAEESASVRLPIDGTTRIGNEPYNGIFLEFGIGQR